MAFPISGTLADLWINPNIEDGLDILAMIVPLTTEEARARRERFGVSQVPSDDTTYYRCVHWDEDTRLCRNYASRPRMCRCYPYGQKCEHGCGLRSSCP